MIGYSSATIYQAAWGSLSLDPTVCDGNTATGVSAGHSPPNDVTAAIDQGSAQSIPQIDFTIAYADNSPSVALEWSLDHVIWSTSGLPALSPPPHGGVFSLWTTSLTGLALTAEYLRLSVGDPSGGASVRELTVPVAAITVSQGAPGGDRSAVVLFQTPQMAPGADLWATPSVDFLAVVENSPGADAARISYREITIAERAPGIDAGVPFVPTLVWRDGAPGREGGAGTPSLCTVRERSKYCPNGDGTYNTGYAVTLLSQYNQVNIDPSVYVTFSPITNVNNPLSFGPNQGIDVEPLVEAALAWWRPLTNYGSFRYANSSGAIGEVIPDDTANNFLNGFLGDYVAFSLRVVRTGTGHNASGQIRPDGKGGHLFHVISETSRPLSDTQEFYWNSAIGDPPGILVSSERLLGFHAADSEECFTVNPYYDNTPAHQITCLLSNFTGFASDSFVYGMSAEIWDTITFTWFQGFYTYSHSMYSCCAGDCPPCEGDLQLTQTIPSGSAGTVCLASSFVVCSELPSGSTIEGPEPFAGEMSIVGSAGCQCLIQTHCLTRSQIADKKYSGPYTVRIPLSTKCLQQGNLFRCEMLVGTFYLSAGEICDTGGVDSNPFNLQDEHGRYHITGGGGAYKRSNFGTNKSVGWAAESTIDAPAGRSLYDMRVIVDDRQSVIAAYAQQVVADSSWDGVYYRLSNDDGETWEDAVLAISGGHHPTIAIGTDGTFDLVVIAAYVGPTGGPGVISAKSRAAGDADFGDAFNFKDSAGNDLSAEDDTFQIQQARDDQSRWMLHIVIHGEGGSSQWSSYDECQTWERVT